jgi:hypothetical protein
MSTSTRSARSSIQGTIKKQTRRPINRQKRKKNMAQDERRAIKRKLSGIEESIKESSIYRDDDSFTLPSIVSQQSLAVLWTATSARV